MGAKELQPLLVKSLKNFTATLDLTCTWGGEGVKGLGKLILSNNFKILAI